jgi:hypothetical protein
MNLYRRSSLQASFALLLACVLGFTAATAQRRKPHKLRATALLEFSRDPSGATTARVIPITILDEGSFHDASIYKAAPQPMALDAGVVYEAQKSGQPVGYVTVGKATKKEDIWMAFGRWQLVSSTPKAQAAASPAGNQANSGDDRPILHRAGSNAPAPSAPASPSPTPDSSSTSSASDDRPILHRPAGDASAQTTPTPAATPSPASTTPAPEPEPEDPNRPTLRHRTPQSVQEQQEAVQASAQPSGGTGGTPTLPASSPSASTPGAQPGAQGLVAVSDAQSGDSRSYEFVWKAGEQAQMEAKMRRLALAQLPKESPPLTERSLANVVIRSFDLDMSNDAVMVLTAELPPSPVAPPTRAPAKAGGKAAGSTNAPAASAAPAKPVSRYITLIARVDTEGNPQKLSASVTDSSRLDVAPRLELIDAVDVDGDGLAELLFREYDFDQKSFIVYGVGRGAVTKVFEGASVPLK